MPPHPRPQHAGGSRQRGRGVACSSSCWPAMGGCGGGGLENKKQKKVTSAHLLEGPPETDGEAKAKAERREAKAARDRQKKSGGN